MAERTILIEEGGVATEMGFLQICSGYLVEGDKVLLVHHNGFDMWVPPGGHIEPGETFASTAVREFKEETGLDVEAISSRPNINPHDSVAVAEPVPFYVDVEHGFDPPAIVQFFWMRRRPGAPDAELAPQAEEVHDARWFTADELQTLATFDQVRVVAAFALANHPDAVGLGQRANVGV